MILEANLTSLRIYALLEMGIAVSALMLLMAVP
jgi:hypothetical protein